MKSQYKKDIESSWKMSKGEVKFITTLIAIFLIGILVGIFTDIQICGECVKAI